MMLRPIVTSQLPDGTSYVARIDKLKEARRGIGSSRVWAIDDLESLRLPFLGAAVPPQSAPSAEETPEALRTSTPKPAGAISCQPPRDAAAQRTRDWAAPLHWHDTFDLQWPIAGSLTIGLDGGSCASCNPEMS
jgi:hypothetical protein